MNTEESNSIKMFPAGLRVLVVDDDEICLKMVETMLKRCEYEVVAVQNAMDALSILRERRGGFDLVLTDVHMPEMDGFELLEHIGQEFKLPVIMISVDSQETLVTRSLENGASFYLFKPLSMNEIKNLWQYVFLKRGSENNATPENGNVGETLPQGRASDGDIECASSVNEGNWKQQESKKTSDDDSSSDEEDKEHSNNQKRARVVWHNGLHEKFLKAIDRLGVDKAVPKKILQQMGVPGLTRENVASHLQKYRIFLRRYKDANGSTANFARSLSDATFRSTFGPPHPSLVYNLPQGLPQFPQQQQQQQHGRTPFQPGFRGNVQGFNTLVNMPSIGASHFFNQDASVSNPMPQLGHGQSLSMNNQGNLQHPLFDTGLNVSHRSSTNSLGFGNVSNSTRMSTSLHGDSTGFGRNAGSVQMAHQQAHMGFGNSAYSLGYNANALNLHGQNNISSIENVGSFGNGDQLPNNNSNFAGIQVTSNGNLAGFNQMRPIGNAILNGAYSSFNRKDDIRRGKMPINATENTFPILESNSLNFGNAAQNAASSNGFASANHFPTMFNNVIQQQPLLAQRPPPLQQQQQQQQQQQTFEDGGSEIDGLLGMLKSNSISQLLDYDADFSDVIFKDAEQSSEQQQDGEEIVDADFNFSAYHMDNNPPSI